MKFLRFSCPLVFRSVPLSPLVLAGVPCCVSFALLLSRSRETQPLKDTNVLEALPDWRRTRRRTQDLRHFRILRNVPVFHLFEIASSLHLNANEHKLYRLILFVLLLAIFRTPGGRVPQTEISSGARARRTSLGSGADLLPLPGEALRRTDSSFRLRPGRAPP